MPKRVICITGFSGRRMCSSIVPGAPAATLGAASALVSRPKVGIGRQRSPAPAAVLEVPRSSPGSPWLDYVEWIACSGGRQEVDRVDDRHGDNVILRAKIESANPVYDLLCEYRCLHIGRLQLAK